MTIDYKQLEALVREAMFTGGGINEPSAPKGVPHRMPAGDDNSREQDMGDPKANKLYAQAVKAREAVEELVEALDEPIYDGAYEHAFRASSSMRKALNSIEGAGAHPMPDEQVVAPPASRQRWGGYVPYQGAIDYGAGVGIMGLEEIATGEEPPEVLRLKQSFDRLGEEEKKHFIALLPSPDEGLEEASPTVGARAKKIAAAAQSGSTQTADAIEQQLASILTGAGVTPLKLRDALISLLTDLGLKNAKQVALLIAKGLAAKQKGQ